MANKDDSSESQKSVSSIKSSKYSYISVPKLLSKFKLSKIRLIKKYVLIFIVFILVAVLSGFSGAWLEEHTLSQSQAVLNGSLSNQKQIITSDSQLISEIAKTVGPSVVSINDTINSSGSSTTNANSLNNFGLFGFVQPQTTTQAAGTGIILTSSGLVITNRHVVPVGTTNISITLSNGHTFKNVSVVGRSNNPSLDIAFLKINNLNGQKLTPAVLGNSSAMQVGDPVVAIGNALGQFQNTVTSGIISGYGRNIVASSSSGSGLNLFGNSTSNSENLSDLFQTDAAINEGNSGGPLVNLNGQVIGINVAIAGNAQNIGFSIPINDLKGIINQILTTGKFSLPYLGIRYIPLTPSIANQYNLSVSNGAFIAPVNSTTSPSIVPNSPAQKAGLEPGDVITAINSMPINQENSLDSLLYQYSPGTSVKLSVLRNNKYLTITVVLGSSTSV